MIRKILSWFGLALFTVLLSFTVRSNAIADREFNKVLYGETSPYARTIEYATINNVSRQDAIDFYQT